MVPPSGRLLRPASRPKPSKVWSSRAIRFADRPAVQGRLEMRALRIAIRHQMLCGTATVKPLWLMTARSWPGAGILIRRRLRHERQYERGCREQ